MVRFDNKISFLDLLFNGILDFQRSMNRKTFSKFSFFAQNQSKTCWDTLDTLYCVIELVYFVFDILSGGFWKPMIRSCYEWCYSGILFFIPIPTCFFFFKGSSSRINWWKLWLSMDCLSIWQAGHYLAKASQW